MSCRSRSPRAGSACPRRPRLRPASLSPAAGRLTACTGIRVRSPSDVDCGERIKKLEHRLFQSVDGGVQLPADGLELGFLEGARPAHQHEMNGLLALPVGRLDVALSVQMEAELLVESDPPLLHRGAGRLHLQDGLFPAGEELPHDPGAGSEPPRVLADRDVLYELE